MNPGALKEKPTLIFESPNLNTLVGASAPPSGAESGCYMTVSLINSDSVTVEDILLSEFGDSDMNETKESTN